MRAIRRSKEYQALIETLVEKKDPETGVSVFPTIKDLQCYAAMLGFQKGERRPLNKKADELDDIQWVTFNDKRCPPYIYLIALAESQNIDVLKYDIESSKAEDGVEDMIKIFEEYANGGFLILQHWLDKEPSDIYGASAIIQGLKRDGFLCRKDAEQNFEDVEF